MIFRYESPDRALCQIQKDNGEITADDIKNFGEFVLLIQRAHEEHIVVEQAYDALNDEDDEELD